MSERWLAAHADSPSLASPTASRAAWLTGQSSPTQQRLSPAQERFLDGLAPHGWTPLRAGFPWTERAAAGTYGGEPLFAASVRNTRQGLAARPGSALARDVARHLQPLLDTTRDRLLLLCASAGARLVTSAVDAVEVPEGLRIDVVGIGAVGALPPTHGPWHVHVLRGRSDLLSAVSHRRRADAVVPGGHLRAAASPAMLAAVLDLVGGGTSA
ncbi:hypothetical protein [Serinibacter arcticus]|uniref:hypothetical protein n=1 Tax=Serinibacter arcticus TaxID=1655435 RepID=UPI0011B1EE05|nr:hypothetical protein [Serinibacter arcticus]